MNVIAPSPDLTVLESPSAACPPSPGTEDQPATNQLHRKIAKLPNRLRDLINSMLDDNLPASQIIAKLQASVDPPLPYPISEVNISDWKKTGYQRYLAQQERLAFVQANREAAQDMVAAGDTTTLPEATLQIIASQYYDLMGDFSPIALKEKLAEDPLKYTRFLNVFARLTREIVVLKKHRDACAKTAAAEPKELDTDRDLSDNENQLMVKKFDRVFKIRRRNVPAALAPVPVGPLPPAGGLAQPEGMPQSADREPSSARSTSTLASASGIQESAPNIQAIQVPVGTLPPAGVPESRVEKCHYCRKELPPLQSDGQRPFTHCQKCSTALRAPETLHFYCPACAGNLRELIVEDRRTSSNCPWCAADLPPWPEPPQS